MKLYVGITLSLAIVLIIVLAACRSSQDGRTPVPYTVEVTTVAPESLRETAWFTVNSATARAPLFVLLPMLGQTHESFQPFMDSVKNYVAAQPGDTSIVMPNFLAIDLRGHGKSTLKGPDTLDYADMDSSQFALIPEDVALMIRKVIREYGDHIDTSFIVVIGASIGANAAMLLTEKIPHIHEVVMLSPGEDYRGLQPSRAFAAYNGQTLIVTGRRDKYAFESSQRIATTKMEKWYLKIYPTANHGTDLINADSRAMYMVINWIYKGDG